MTHAIKQSIIQQLHPAQIHSDSYVDSVTKILATVDDDELHLLWKETQEEPQTLSDICLAEAIKYEMSHRFADEYMESWSYQDDKNNWDVFFID